MCTTSRKQLPESVWLVLTLSLVSQDLSKTLFKSPQAPLPQALAFVRLGLSGAASLANWPSLVLVYREERGCQWECLAAHPPLWARLTSGHPPCGAAHMELNAISERKQAAPILYCDCRCYQLVSQVTKSAKHSSARLCDVMNSSNLFWMDSDWSKTDHIGQLAWSICIWSCRVVSHPCLNRVQTDWRQLDIHIRAKALRDYQKRPFQSFSSTSPLSSFAYEHSPKYPHKRLMSLCCCILPFIGWETMHQSVRLSTPDSYGTWKRCYATRKCILIVQSLGAACK